MNVASVSNVMATATAGMQSALNQFSAAAANIVSDTAVSVSPSSGGPAPAPVSASAIQAQTMAGSDLPTQIVSTIEARNAFMANIAVAKAADDNFKALLGVLA
jgi:hypothetical protein